MTELNKLQRARNLIFIAIIFAAPNWGHSASELKHQNLDNPRPTWTSYRSGANLVFYGVGKAKNIPNKALMRLTTYNRARTNLARVMEIFVGKIINAYMTELEQKKSGVSMEKFHVGPVIRSMLDAADLKNIQPDRFWIDPANNTGHALINLKLEDYLKGVEKEFTPEFYSFVLNHAEQIFLEMTKE
jgi:hypothetical protein